MSLLTVVQDVCAVVGIAPLPTSVFAGIASNRTMQEMVSLAIEMAQRIAYDTRDWQRLRKTQTYNGDGLATAFDLPSDFKRMLLTANVWRNTNSMTPMTFYPDSDEWLQRRLRNYTSPFGEWTMQGGQMLIYPTLAVGQSVQWLYLQKYCVALAGGGYSDRFVADGDTFMLDERVLKLGMIWQWKANKGSPYQEDMGTYGDALTLALGHDSPAPIIIGRRPVAANASVAYPWPVPTP